MTKTNLQKICHSFFNLPKFQQNKICGYLKRATTFTRAVFWSFSDQFSRIALRLVVTAFLARLVIPEAFGLVAMANIFVGFLGIFKNFGLSAALIYKQDIDKKDLDTVFWFTVFISIILSLIIIFSAGPIADFYHNQKIIPIVRVLAVLFFIGALATVPDTLIRKVLNFKAYFLRNISNIIISGLIAIYLAYRGWGVWALIVQQFISQTYHIIVSFKLVAWRPGFHFKWERLKPFLSYSWPLFGLNMVNYFSRNVDTLVIGRFLGAGNVGYYNKAYSLMRLPVNNISSSVSRVLFPDLSYSQNNRELVWKKYLRLMSVTAFVTFPLMAIMYLLADDIILLLYGPKWGPSIPLFKALCILGAFQTLTYTGTIFQSIGKTKIIFYLNIFLKLFIVIGILVGFYLGGLMGVIWGLTLTSILGLVINKYFLAKTFNHSLLEIVKSISKEFFSTALFVIMAGGLIHYFPSLKILIVILALGIYILFSMKLKSEGFIFVQEKLGSIIQNFKKSQ